MERTQVSSSQIISIGYDPAHKILEIEFPRTGVYHYYDVPADMHQRLLSSESHGRFLSAEIKPSYHCERKKDIL